MRLIPTTAALALALLSTHFACADPLAPASLPATAKWVVHVDMDAARDTTLWQFLEQTFITNRPGADNKINAVETMTGMKFPADLHDITIFGPSFDKGDAAILIHAVVNKDKITDLLKLNPEFASTSYNGHDVLTWRDGGQDRLLYGSFFDQNRVIVAPSKKLVADALDALDNKIEVLKPDAPLVAGIPEKKPDQPKAPSPILYVSGLGLADLPKVQNPLGPVIAQADSGWLALTESDKKILARALVTAKSDKAARQMILTAEGLRAILDLAAADEKADAKTKVASAALEGLTLRRDAKNIAIELPLTLETLQNIIDAIHNAAPPKDPAAPKAP